SSCPARSWITRCRAPTCCRLLTPRSARFRRRQTRSGCAVAARAGSRRGLAAVANAIVDALAEFGVEHIELLATPERVWNAIRAARGKGTKRCQDGPPL